MVSTSKPVKVRSFANWPLCSGEACHGGMVRATTCLAMALAHGRTSGKLVSAIGAIIPPMLLPLERWHFWQFSCKMGWTSLWNVGFATGTPSANATPPMTANPSASAAQVPIFLTRIDSFSLISFRLLLLV